MRRIVMMAVLVFGMLANAMFVESVQAQGHSYGYCVQAASYQLAECLDMEDYPNTPYDSGDCWDTFYFLRDHPLGCLQFPY